MGEGMAPDQGERPDELAGSEDAEGGAYTYIVECSDGTLYTGWAKDVQARVKAHNAGRGAQYTRGRRPVRLRYCERHPSRRAAMRRERKMKRLSRRQKLALIAGFRGRGKPGP
jgi:putative endonuclease